MSLLFREQKTASGNRLSFLWLLLILAVVAAIRVRLLDMPLERDEGEFAYGAQLMLHGVSIYKEAYIDALRLPGTCAAYALTMALFGQTTAAIHTAALLVTLATAFFVFLLTWRICGNDAGAVAAGAYAILSINPPSFGLAAHATHFVMLPAIAGIFLLQNLDERSSRKRLFFAGLLLGIALVMKQTGAVFGVFAAAWVAYLEFISGQKSYRRLIWRLCWLALGISLPFALTCALIASAGDLPRFWFWIFEYGRAHASIITFTKGLETAGGVVSQLIMAAPALWGVGLAGIVLLFFQPSLRRWRFFILSFLLFSIAAVCPGWRGHYFIQLFPAMGLLAGVAFYGVSSVLERFKIPPAKAVLIATFFVILATPLLQWGRIYFTYTPPDVARAIYPGNPFPEAVEIGRYLTGHCPPDGSVAILGSEPEIYFYSHRRAATAHIDTYPLMEPQPYAIDMQREMIRQIENANPDYVIFVHVPVSWLQYSDSNPSIFFWFQQYQRRHLRLVGLVEMHPDSLATYHWFNGNVTNVQSTADSWISIFQKR